MPTPVAFWAEIRPTGPMVQTPSTHRQRRRPIRSACRAERRREPHTRRAWQHRQRSKKPPSLAAVNPFLRIPLAAVDHDRRSPRKRLDIAHQRRLVVEAVGLQLRRLVTRLPATVFHRFNQRALLVTDVTARTGKPRRGS